MPLRHKFGPRGGVEEVAKMLQELSEPERSRILIDLARRDPALAAQIQARMFTFEDLTKEDPALVQRFLRSVPQKKLALALRGTSDELQKFIFAQMSETAARLL